MKKLITLTMAVGLWGCSHNADVSINTGQDAEDQSNEISPEPAPEPEPEPQVTSVDTRVEAGKILRKDLMVVINQGPAFLLQKVQTKPFRQNGKFVGFQIAAFTQESPTTIDLKPGDVILKVNGRKVERPEHYFEIFQELKVAGELRFDILREGTKETLLYPIVD